ncbi:MAG: hypothetical protein R3E79_31090 [Caldilineaceae bacterium]
MSRLFRRLRLCRRLLDLMAVEAIATTAAFSQILQSLIGKSLVRSETLANGEPVLPC